MRLYRERFEQALRAKGMKKKVLAEHLGVHRKTLTNWTAGKSGPNRFQLQEIARLLYVSPESLVAKEDAHLIPILSAGTAGPLADQPPPHEKPAHVARFQSGPFLVELRAWYVEQDPFQEKNQ